MEKTQPTEPKPPALWREELKRAWRELRGVDQSPGRAAAAVALGLFVGSEPVPGFHTPVVLTICLLLQLDGLLAWIAANISNPFFAPFLITAEVQAGGYVHTGAPLPFDVKAALNTGLGEMLVYAFSGWLILGPALALVGAGLTYLVMLNRSEVKREPYALPAHAPPWWHASERVAGRYAPVGERSTPAQRSRFHYVRIKLLSDPVSQILANLFGDQSQVLGEVLDIGTGRGQLPILLLELGRAKRVHGLDWDAEKIAAARQAAAVDPALSASFEAGDARDLAYREADTVLLIDVIHYLRIDEQDAVLRRAAARVRLGGHLVVREADSERGWRSWVTLAEEKVLTTLRFNRGARVQFRPAREIVAVLEAEGLVCEVRPAWGSTPFSNVLVIGKRAG